MIKQTFVVLALVGFVFSAPQPRKLFHEHVKDFLDTIVYEVSHKIDDLVEHYLLYEEFVTSLQYIQTDDFKDFFYEMESLPEFKAVVDFLENNNIDIYFFIDMIHTIIDDDFTKRSARHYTSGKNSTLFIEDCIALFPKKELSALFEDKMANDEEFSSAINNLQGEEWDRVFTALWDSEMFQKEVAILQDNGIDIYAVLYEIKAIFGQD